MTKVQTIFSEIGRFFKENDVTSAMNAIMDMTKSLWLSEKRLFGEESKCNCKLTQLQVLGLLMLFPCFKICNAYNYSKSSLCGLFFYKRSKWGNVTGLSPPTASWTSSRLTGFTPGAGLWKSSLRKVRETLDWESARCATSPHRLQ
ncbi:MAG: hypothetical protein IJL54_02130 [Prevotella sp.]|nr:hypothetical protein [Prevotella sp.]